MKSISFIVQTEADLKLATSALELTFNASSILGGKFNMVLRNVKDVRKDAQSNLSHCWYRDIAEQKGDETKEEIRAFCKLTIGIPIRNEDPEYKEVYYRVIRPLPYETKLEIMVGGIDFPVTRGMSVKQMTQYLNEVDMCYAKQGIIVPKFDDNYYLAMGVKKK